MVRGIETFRRFFQDFSDSYLIIGGTACDIIIDAAQMTPRATKDIDIILVIEALKPAFVKRFRDFIREGNYEKRETNETKRNFYRFRNPENPNFPRQIELFSRVPDMLTISAESRFTPIPVYDDISSLSAILLNEEYYHFTIQQSIEIDNLHLANSVALICLKAKAYLDMTERKAKGEKIDTKNINKHKSDVFRMALTLAGTDAVPLPESIKGDLSKFVSIVKNNLPDNRIFKEMNAASEISSETVFDEMIRFFKI